MKNGRQVGGYSLESYEPMDPQFEEKNQIMFLEPNYMKIILVLIYTIFTIIIILFMVIKI